jgi:hypothetical protein
MRAWWLPIVLTSWTLSSPAHTAPICATTALRDLPPLVQASTGILQRPVGLSSRLSDDGLPLLVHAGEGRDELAGLVLREAAAAWRVQIEGAGFPPPLRDDVGFEDGVFEDGGFEDGASGDPGDHPDIVDGALDIYLSALPPGIGAVTVSGRDVDQDPRHDRRPTFIVIDPGQPQDVVAAAVHHEFQHALQFAIDARESAMWFESTAVAFEVRGRPDVTAWHLAVPSFQRQPHAPLSTDGVTFFDFGGDDDLRYEYGAALFPLFLDDVYGAGDGVIVRELWQSAAGHADDIDEDTNRPDWLTAVPAVLGVSFAEVLLEFVAWRALAPPLSVPGAGPSAYGLPGTSSLRGQRVLLERLSGTPRTPSEAEGPFVGGCHVTVASQPSSASSTPLRVSATSLDGSSLGAVVVLVSERAAVIHEDVGVSGEPVSVDVVVDPGVEVVVAVCSLSLEDADAPPAFSPIALTLSTGPPAAEGEGEGDGEGEGEGEDGEGAPPVESWGCSCDSTSSSGAGDPRRMRQGIGLLGFFVGVIGFVVKLVRHRRRKALYARPPATSTSTSTVATPPSDEER